LDNIALAVSNEMLAEAIEKIDRKLIERFSRYVKDSGSIKAA